ncbi:sugar nucleotide-binding protein [Desulfovibrio sp. JC010]|uniref:sugar nucleotide-binding protein n=1 Tax=Desulfovibrio sp. JC010 TaxID=2593641 RepID=UPI0013D789AB|nr:sugar nucleotide-binding protein [Desulfovibrio sp. JC010]NDV26694.1 sugar nucleotide-binding protein [Desulfovibrio sp. JC010]
MKILVIGDGSLGNAIAGQIRQNGHEVIQTSRKNPVLIHFELKDEPKFTNLPNADWAVIGAGISGYRECADHPESRTINVDRTIELCKALLKRGTKILYPSSTAVFDGEKAMPAPKESTCPATEYGRQKTDVENFLRKFPGQTAIVRLTKLLDRKTPLISGWLDDLAAGNKITPFSDLSIAPVLFEDAALGCCRIMEADADGIFHCSGPQEISYLEFGRKLCSQAGFDNTLIEPASCMNFLNYCPKHSALETAETEELIGFKFPHAQQVIEELLCRRCLLCGSTELRFFEQYNSFPGITSDCKPWPRAGEFMICKECGHPQKKLSPQWFKDINGIYSGYEMYPLSAGNEPLIFDEHGKGSPRSGILMDKLISALSLPEKGSVLDVGCGNGSLLQQFHMRRPKWNLYGHEQSEQREEILHLQGVQSFYSGPLKNIGQKFDLITMTYVIEHLVDPVDVLKQLGGLLREGGQIMIHTSSFADNPFDLMVCDHCSHFTPETLEFMAAQAGLKITAKTDPWLTKEIGFTARKSNGRQIRPKQGTAIQSLAEKLRWLDQLARKAEQISTKQETGIFGTAVAGTWLGAVLKGNVSFFVDEDPGKQGQRHMGLPIISPADIPAGAVVVMGFNKKLGTHIAKRIQAEHPFIDFLISDE